MGRPEDDMFRMNAMKQLGSGLFDAKRHDEALSVQEAELSTLRRLGAPEVPILVVQSNLASSYQYLRRYEEALRLRREVYSGHLKLDGKEHEDTLRAANNYASTLVTLRRFEEAKSVLRKTMPVARRVLGENHDHTLKVRWIYAMALHSDADAAIDDIREAVTTLKDAERIARRVLGGAHPTTTGIEYELRDARAALRAREAPPSSSGGA